MDTRQVVVTGIGILTGLGADMPSVWRSLLHGRSAVKRLRETHPELLCAGVALAAPAVNFELDTLSVPPRLQLQMDQTARMTVYAGLHALRDAGLSWPEDTQRYNIGAVVGTGNAFADRYASQPIEQRNPKWFLETYPNLPLGFLSSVARLPGSGMTIVSACTSGTHAIGTAFRMIQSGKADILLAGATEAKICASALLGFRRLNMCTPSDDPEAAMRPFDQSRTGFVVGSGACFLVLERRDYAEARGARIRCAVVGYGASMNTGSLTDADRDGVQRAMAAALKDAKLEPFQIGYVNAHGTSTQSNDREETAAIKDLFGKRAYKIPVSSTKSMLGHTFAACGAIESAVCAATLETQTIHPTRNFENGGRECDLDYVKGGQRPAPVQYALNNSSGVGGYNASVILSKVA